MSAFLSRECNIAIQNTLPFKESRDYEAASFSINAHKILYRQSRITPAKTGQFVAIWKRNNAGITQPFDITDEFDFMMIAAKAESLSGIFIFPKEVLSHHGVVSINGKGGKRGIRVYPPWNLASNKQATQTQEWQTKYFINLSEGNKSTADSIVHIFS